jgi:hypothetical protein
MNIDLSDEKVVQWSSGPSQSALLFAPYDSDVRDLTEEIESLEVELFLRFGGWTFQGYVKGAYRMADGTQSLDECRFCGCMRRRENRRTGAVVAGLQE